MSSKDTEKTQHDGLQKALQQIGTSLLSPDELQSLAAPYHDLIGQLPPRVQARHQFTGAIDHRLVALQEDIRTHVMSPSCFDNKTTQLLIFGMLMMELSDAAKTHAIAARRCGASWVELQAVVSLCFLFRGIPAANRGAALLAELALQDSVA